MDETVVIPVENQLARMAKVRVELRDLQRRVERIEQGLSLINEVLDDVVVLAQAQKAQIGALSLELTRTNQAVSDHMTKHATQRRVDERRAS